MAAAGPVDFTLPLSIQEASPACSLSPQPVRKTAGYWPFLERNAERSCGNHRMRQALRGLDRLKDLDELAVQERSRGDAPP